MTDTPATTDRPAPPPALGQRRGAAKSPARELAEAYGVNTLLTGLLVAVLIGQGYDGPSAVRQAARMTAAAVS